MADETTPTTSGESKPDWDDDFEEVLRLHSNIRAYVLEVHYESGERSAASDKAPTVAEGALDVISHDCALIHGNVAVICMAGFSSVAAILVRTQMELMISTMAIVLHEKPELMAYKYMYFGSKKGLNDKTFPKAERDRQKLTCLDGLEMLPDELREEARRWVFGERLPSFWYGVEYGGPTELLGRYMPGFEEIYRGLSATTHGGYIGARLFRDDPDDLGLEPRRPGMAAQRILATSARFMLDQTLYRAHFLHLRAESKYNVLRQRLDSLKRLAVPRITDEERRMLLTHKRIRPTTKKK